MTSPTVSDRALRFLQHLEASANPEYSLPIFDDRNTEVWHVGDTLNAPDPLPLAQIEQLATAGYITFQTYERGGIRTHFGRLTDLGRLTCSGLASI